MTEKTVIDDVEMCVVDAQDEPIRFTVSLAIRLVIGKIMDERVVAAVCRELQ